LKRPKTIVCGHNKLVNKIKVMDTTTRWLLSASGVFLIIGCLPLNFTYYEFLRGIVSIAAIALTITAARSRQFAWLMISFPSFILWCPIFGIETDKRTWLYLDLVFGILYLVASLVIAKALGEKK